jgi:flagellar biosynthesis component FlhA
MGYCPVSAERLKEMGIDAEAGVVEAPHPTTGQPGCWLARDLWPLVVERKLELWDDPLLYTIYHLDVVLRRNLADFLGTQEFKNLLETWKQTETGQALVEAAAPDQKRELRLGRTLRSLLKEQVPITNWEEILRTVKAVGLPTHDVHKVVCAVRLKLKQQLPGNTPNARALELPSEIEKTLGRWLRNESGKMFIAIPPAPVNEFFRDVSKLVEANPDALLIVESAELRPFVRRILKLRFPGIRVLARAELASQPGSASEKNSSSNGRINEISINA